MLRDHNDPDYGACNVKINVRDGATLCCVIESLQRRCVVELS